MDKNYVVINASAGSGKTYSLVLRLLSICLRYLAQPSVIGNILALTFTNKAANEMKHRIIDWLRKFSSDSYLNNAELLAIQEDLENLNIKVTLEELHRRAKKILDYVLHNYSALNIGTIDRFNSRLVRSFSNELGLAQNFNLEINAEPYLLEAVDKMLDEIGEENVASDAFMDFVNYSLDNDDRVNLHSTLYKSAKEYMQDKHYFRLMQNKDFDWAAYEKTKSGLRARLRQLQEQNMQTVTQVLELLAEKNLDIADFAGGKNNGLGKFFQEAHQFLIGNRKDFPLPGNETTAMECFLKGASAGGKKREAEIFEILDYLLEARQKLISNHLRFLKTEKVLAALLPLKVNKEIQDKLAFIEDENDLVLLSKFNVIIHENLSSEPSSFIYEKVGTKFSHYFFDEFQDTSLLQWQNMLPLRDHAVSTENMTFTLVGDPKQSIYRFRGGDSQLMLDIINKKEKSPAFAHLQNLESNWRSAKNIVDFNNRLYDFHSKFVSEEHCALFGNDAQQLAQSPIAGRVRINLFENSTNAVFYEALANRMCADIQTCVENGFRLSDIAILCRGNTEISTISRLLGALTINYDGKEAYVKIISDSGLTLSLSATVKALTEYLRWMQNPENMQFPVKMLYFLKEYGRISSEDFTAEMMEMLQLKTKAEAEDFIMEKYGLQLRTDGLLPLNLYNTIEHYLQEFSVNDFETDYLFSYLELVYAYTQNNSGTLKDFLKYWDEEGHETAIQASDNLDAVKIMTIHKAKGLEFPVVFLPMRNSNQDKKFTDWFDVEGEESCASVSVKSFDEKMALYDTQMLEFNERNIYANKIDRFCLQYVATTRAVEQLFFYLEKENKTKNHLEIYEFLKLRLPPEVLAEENAAFDFYETNTESLLKQGKEEESELVPKTLVFRAAKARPDAIRIATPSKSYQHRVEHVRTGILTHDILSRISYREDVEPALERYLREGTITAKEKEEIAARIFKIIDSPEYSGFFSNGLKVFNEKDIMITENGETKMYRPDRLVETEEGFVIIDFKTGIPRTEHDAQMAQYQSVLQKLGKNVLSTELIYI